MKNILATSLLMFSSISFAASGIVCEEGTCKNKTTKSWYGITFTPSYKTLYNTHILNIEDSCEDNTITDDKKINLPVDSRFRQTLDREGQNSDEMLIHVYTVDEQVDPTGSSNDSKSYTKETFFSNPFKVCLKGEHAVPESKYKRIGGISTGILVVPFKLRSGDIFSDSTIGPYISYKWTVTELLFTSGLSQISLSEVGTTEIESKSGITFAIGINFEVDKNWDIAILTGADHLSGSTGDNWEYQDELWLSFAIGFNFTR